MSEPKERPILFSSPMVRAILDGRKTQTRRVVKPQPGEDATNALPVVEQVGWRDYEHRGSWKFVKYRPMPDGADSSHSEIVRQCPCPYGKPGDRLWLREAWRTRSSLERFSATEIAVKAWAAGYAPGCPIRYEADHEERLWGDNDEGDFGPNWGRLRPSMFMPRWASRITLEVTGVRLERVQDISGRDAAAEGFAFSCYMPELPDGTLPATELAMVDRFASTWRKMNDKRERCGWDDNPWVWVIEFKRIEANL